MKPTALAGWTTCLLVAHVLAGPPVPESVLLPSPADYPHGITSDGTNLWTTDYDAKMLYCIDPSDGHELSAFTTTNLTGSSIRSPRGCAWHDGDIWVATKDDIWQIDLATTSQIDRLKLEGTSLQGLAHDGTNLWVSDASNSWIFCIDPGSGSTNLQFASPASSPRGLEYHDGSLWQVDSYQDRIIEIDPVTGETRSSSLVSRSGPRGIAWHADRFWLNDKDVAGIVGFPMSHDGATTRTTAYVSRGTVTCGFTNTNDIPYFNTHVYSALAHSDGAADILSRRFFTNDVECVPTGCFTDEFGQVSADFNFGSVAPDESIMVEIEYTARLHNWTVNVDSNQVGTVADIDPALWTLYTRDEEMYDIHSSIVSNNAAEAVGTETNLFTMAHLIHDHVITSLTYNVDSIWEEASLVLVHTNASCTGYAFAMIGLCRARGIPARFAGGSECRSFDTNRVDTLHHRWVEVYIPPYGWVPFDPTHDEPYPVDSTHLRWREVGAQQRALVLRRGGGTNEMGWSYTSDARHAMGYIDTERSVVWVGLPWADGGDFDEDGVTNSADAFAYDRAASLDSDGDGMPDDWNGGYGVDDTTSVPPLVVDDNDDNDGLTDEEEAIAGTDPADANSTLAIQGLAVVDGTLHIQWPSVDSRIYGVWTNATIDSTSVCECAAIAATHPLNTYTTDLPATPTFYRIRVEMEESP